MNVWDIVKNINDHGEDLYPTQVDGRMNEYTPFIVNRNFSFFPDTILYANEMNRYSNLSERMQYHFYRFSLRKRKRFEKWMKNEKSPIIDAIIFCWKYSRQKALMIVDLIDDETKESLLREYETTQSKK